MHRSCFRVVILCYNDVYWHASQWKFDCIHKRPYCLQKFEIPQGIYKVRLDDLTNLATQQIGLISAVILNDLNSFYCDYGSGDLNKAPRSFVSIKRSLRLK